MRKEEEGGEEAEEEKETENAGKEKQESKQLGVLRPVNQCGYVRVRKEKQKEHTMHSLISTNHLRACPR